MTLEEAKKLYPPVYTIYDRPNGHPHTFIARACYGEVKGPIVALVDDLLMSAQQAVEMIRATLVRDYKVSEHIERTADDDPKILESWQ